ncbi:MAG TPA: hypothetical protein DHV36_11725 [Desulfobacteraceae bacterium]|nr:hypothetical protein [Desulfobacteraceae bacterium]
MRITPLEYVTADNLSQAVELLDSAGPQAAVLAGGTDLVLNLKKKRACPCILVSLQAIDGIDRICLENGMIRIGAMATHDRLARHPLLREKADILCQAAGLIGSWQIRNAGTIGGNICNASPAGDALPPLLALDAAFVTAGTVGETVISARNFFTGPGQTRLPSGHLLKEIRFPCPPANAAGCYMKLRRRKAVDISIAGVAFQAALNEEGTQVASAGIALGGVAPTPVRVPGAEDLITGRSPKEALENARAIGAACVAAASPIDDLRASADYKRTIVNVFAQRCARHVLTTLKEKGKPQ